jgi:hypothetical protein
MGQALAELRGPVNQEALRLRMSALHGREDALLDAARFPRLLRQANDAEIADVRKVGEDDYEITPRRGAALPPLPTQPPAAPALPPAEAEPPVEAEPAVAAVSAEEAEPVASEPAGRGDGLRFGVRFRRGSRGGLRTSEYPLVGVVQMDEPAAAVPASTVVGNEAAESGAATAKPARSRRAPRKKAGGPRAKAEKPAKAEASAPAAQGEAAAPAPAKRPRARTRKKAE